MTAAPYGRRGGLIAGLGFAVAVALAGYGIRSRGSAVTELQHDAYDAAVPRVRLAAPKSGPTQRTETLPGNVEAWNQAPIYAQVSGYVTRWYKDYGASVRKGDVLAEIDAPSLDAQYEESKAQLETAAANYNLAQKTADRYNELRGSAAVPQQQIDNYVSAATAAKAQMEAAQESVNRYSAMIGFEKVTAPFDGVVTARQVSVGDFVTSAGGDAAVQGSAKPLFTVADVTKLRVFVAVPQNFGLVLKPGIAATLTLPNAPEKPIKADFLTQASAVNPSTRTIVTELVVSDGQRALFPGTYVDVHVTVPGAPDILVVPSQALLFRAEGMQVATVDGRQHVHLQNVTVGYNLGLNIQIVSGLTSADRIVENPSLGLLEGQEVKVVSPVRANQPGDSAHVVP